ncbi:hypothetical protein D9758_004400 [Tetrapyrgos nigripes]|uniref:Uncharacterized protein n=1 Tax=Tetrapyrgos nigripes TaxID=182062 RepID=A0A8H5GNQ1_9AGAR|nr:hypothetical protein D9758_004400 [Tetrapyrgos nigripes]
MDLHRRLRKSDLMSVVLNSGNQAETGCFPVGRRLAQSMGSNDRRRRADASSRSGYESTESSSSEVFTSSGSSSPSSGELYSSSSSRNSHYSSGSSSDSAHPNDCRCRDCVGKTAGTVVEPTHAGFNFCPISGGSGVAIGASGAGTISDPIHVGNHYSGKQNAIWEKFFGGRSEIEPWAERRAKAQEFEDARLPANEREVLGMMVAIFLVLKLYGRSRLANHEQFISICLHTITSNIQYLEADYQHTILALHYLQRALPDNIVQEFPKLRKLLSDGQIYEVKLEDLNIVQQAVMMTRAYTLCLRMSFEYLDDEEWGSEYWRELEVMDTLVLNKATRQLEMILGHNLSISNTDWQAWLKHIHWLIGHSIKKYFPKSSWAFDGIFNQLDYIAKAQAWASSSEGLASAVDYHTTLRSAQQERLLLFLTCGLPKVDSRGMPVMNMDDSPAWYAKLVVRDDMPEMVWDQNESPPKEELERSFPAGTEFVEEVDESQWVEYDEEDEVMASVPACRRIAGMPALSAFHRRGLVLEEEYEDGYDEDDEDEDMDMEEGQLYDDDESDEEDEDGDVVLYNVDVSRHQAGHHGGYASGLAASPMVRDTGYIPPEFATQQMQQRQDRPLLYNDEYYDGATAQGVEQYEEDYDEAMEEDEDYVVNDEPFLPPPEERTERRPFGELYYRSH